MSTRRSPNPDNGTTRSGYPLWEGANETDALGARTSGAPVYAPEDPLGPEPDEYGLQVATTHAPLAKARRAHQLYRKNQGQPILKVAGAKIRTEGPQIRLRTEGPQIR